jgi:hypothetical protein
VSWLEGAKAGILVLGKLTHRRRLFLSLILRIAMLSPVSVEIPRRRSGVITLAPATLKVLLLGSRCGEDIVRRN